MNLHPLDPTGGFHIHHVEDRKAIVELANGLILHGQIVSWCYGQYSQLTVSYGYRAFGAQRAEDGSLLPVQRWVAGNMLGSIPLAPEAGDGFGERMRRSLLEAFGVQPQARLRAVQTLARLRQDMMGWANADLILDENHPRGVLKTQIGQQKLTTILLKANRGRRPPDLHAFLGSACQLYVATTSHECTRILRRPEKAGPRLPSGHARMGAVLDLIALFAEHGIDLSPWQNDLLA